MDIPAADLIQMAKDDPSLTYQVLAPPGSTLLFGASAELIESTYTCTTVLHSKPCCKLRFKNRVYG